MSNVQNLESHEYVVMYSCNNNIFPHQKIGSITVTLENPIAKSDLPEVIKKIFSKEGGESEHKVEFKYEILGWSKFRE